MAENSKIEWTDHTFNPWIGCTKVSPGCAHCYAETLMDTRYGKVKWGAGNPRQLTSAANWKLPLKWQRQQEDGEGYPRPRVFCSSLADVLDDEVPIEWLARLLALIRDTPNLDWLLLTKRPQNWRERIDEAGAFANGAHDLQTAAWCSQWLDEGNAPANVWMGTTVEDQTRADERIPALLAIPAKVRFLSCEPLLGAVDLRLMYNCAGDRVYMTGPNAGMQVGKISWVIAGGESGQHARPCHPDWARSIRDQCRLARVAFHWKQWGEWKPISETEPMGWSDALYKRRRIAKEHEDQGVIDELYGHDCTVQSKPIEFDGKTEMYSVKDGHCAYLTFRVGKKAAGRLLDGIEHNGFPTP